MRLYSIEQKRFAFAKDSLAPQLAVKQAAVDQLRAPGPLASRRCGRAPGSGRHGRHPAAGFGGRRRPGPARNQPRARVANRPGLLMAQVQIAETQAKDMQIGESARIDTHNGTVAGRVARIDPLGHQRHRHGRHPVQRTASGRLPARFIGGRHDRARTPRERDLHGAPAFGDEKSTVGLFKLAPDGAYATRAQVELGRSSVNTIEVNKGLVPGDRVILSDMSQWDGNERIKLN